MLIGTCWERNHLPIEHSAWRKGPPLARPSVPPPESSGFRRAGRPFFLCVRPCHGDVREDRNELEHLHFQRGRRGGHVMAATITASENPVVFNQGSTTPRPIVISWNTGDLNVTAG